MRTFGDTKKGKKILGSSGSTSKSSQSAKVKKPAYQVTDSDDNNGDDGDDNNNDDSNNNNSHDGDEDHSNNDNGDDNNNNEENDHKDQKNKSEVKDNGSKNNASMVSPVSTDKPPAVRASSSSVSFQSSASADADNETDDAPPPDPRIVAPSTAKSPSKLQLLKSKMGENPRLGKGKRPSSTKNSKPAPVIPSTKGTKIFRHQSNTSDSNDDDLDFTKKVTKSNSSTDVDTSTVDVTKYNYGDDEDSSEEEDVEDVEDDSKQKPEAVKKGMFSFLSSSLSSIGSIVSGKELTHADLEPTLNAFRELLMSKNVAAAIADKLCDSVATSLEGKKISRFSTIKSTVKHNLEEALTRILTPKKSIDVLQGVLAAKAQHRPYTVVMVGVNGVGKSTSLAKISAYFLNKNLKVMIAACDTFRSGAVEQLRTHAKRLNVPLFERGYNKDPSAVAMDAIRDAKNNGMDVLMIDTAGRMQDNQPLMIALSKLIEQNRPDLVLFVGEALVGNDGVDQLTKFNRCLADMSSESEPRLIDGIVLTKFDTIDDKVGAAISMTYATGQPIIFVGTGQDYGDLKKANVKTLTKALLK